MQKKPFRVSVLVPGSNKTVRFADAREALVRRNAWLGMPVEAMRAKMLKQQADFQRFGKAIDTYNSTGSFEATAKAAGVSRKTAKWWVEGSRLPRTVSLKRADSYLKKRKPLKIRPEGKAYFAYVLGAMMGNANRIKVGPEGKSGRVRMEVKDKAVAEAFAKSVKVSTGIRPKFHFKKTKTGGLFVADFGSANLLQLFNELTDYGTRVPNFRVEKSQARAELRRSGSPVSFLDSKESRLQFAKALFDSRGHFKIGGPAKTKNIVINPLHPELRKFVSIVLQENGFHPRERNSGQIALPSSETGIFMKKIGMRGKSL